MNGYLVAEEGPLAGMTVAFEEGIDDQEWLLGRDPESVDVVLEDPMPVVEVPKQGLMKSCIAGSKSLSFSIS